MTSFCSQLRTITLALALFAGVFFVAPRDASAACVISSIQMRPNGVQPTAPSTPASPEDFPGPYNSYRNTSIAGSGFTEEGYSSVIPLYVYLDLQTAGCENQVIGFDIFNVGQLGSSFGDSIEYVPAGGTPQVLPGHFSDSPNFTIALEAGEKYCHEVSAQWDCRYYVAFNSDGMPGTEYYEGTGDEPILNYECESCGSILSDDPWTYYGIIPFQTMLDQVSSGGFTPGDYVYFSEGYDEYLAPLPGLSTTGSSTLGGFLQSLFTVMIMLAGILAFVMLIVYGIMHATVEAVGMKVQAKEKMWNAIFGLIMALGAWVILNTINPNLASNLSITIPKATFDDVSPAWQNGNAPAGTVIGGSNTVGGQSIAQGAAWPSDAAQRQQLTGAGISINHANCPTAGSSGCTSVYFEGPAAQVISNLTSFKTTCMCELVVTGGSESWLHTTHGPTVKVVDLRKTPSLNAYLRALPGGPAPGDTFPTGKYITIAGVGKFYAEPSGATSNTDAEHWHVTFY